MIQFCVTLAKGIVADRHARRSVLFGVTMSAMVMVFAGALFLNGWLLESPWRFLLYWGACIWLTFLAILLSVYDLLMLRMEAKRERQRLKAQLFGMGDKRDHD